MLGVIHAAKALVHHRSELVRTDPLSTTVRTIAKIRRNGFVAAAAGCVLAHIFTIARPHTACKQQLGWTRPGPYYGLRPIGTEEVSCVAFHFSFCLRPRFHYRPFPSRSLSNGPPWSTPMTCMTCVRLTAAGGILVRCSLANSSLKRTRFEPGRQVVQSCALNPTGRSSA